MNLNLKSLIKACSGFQQKRSLIKFKYHCKGSHHKQNQETKKLLNQVTKMHLSQKYIQDAIHNPLLFQQNNPLISQSMSLLNSRHKKSGDDSRQMQQFTSKQLSARLRKKYPFQNQDQFHQSSQNQYEQDSHYNHHQQDQYNDQVENLRAIKQFERQIEQKFKISVANKIYTFPRLKITSILDIISSSEDSENEEQDVPSKSTSQLTEGQFNPFDPQYHKKKVNTQKFQGKLKSKQNLQKTSEEKNFKKVKISDKNEKKNSSIKKQKEQPLNYSHREKPKNVKKNPQVTTSSKEKQKTKNQTQKIEKPSQKLGTTKNQKPWVVKQSKMQKYNYAERLKTEMDNGSSGMSESITESRKRFYEEQFFIRK